MSHGLPFLARTRRRTVASRAVALWRARNYSSTKDALVDESGNNLHARLGSAVGADSNDPRRLQYRGYTDLYFPGTTGNYLSTPNAAAVQFTGDCTFISVLDTQLIAAASVPFYIGAKWGADGNRSYQLLVTNGSLVPYIQWTEDGSTLKQLTADASLPSSAKLYVKITFDADNGAGGHTARFWHSVNGTSWTQLGSDRTGVGTTSIFNSTAPLYLGFSGGSTYGLTRLVRAQYCSGIDGPVVADFDASRLTEPYATMVAATGETWTFNRSSSGPKLAVVDRDLFPLGTDDYFEAADHPLLNFGARDSFTLAVLFRAYGVASGYERIASKGNNGSPNPGYDMYRTDATAVFTARISDTAATATVNFSGGITSGVCELFAQVRNRPQGLHQAYKAAVGVNTADTIVGSLSSAYPLRIGSSGAGGSHGNFEFIAAAIFREALSAAELARLKEELLR